MCVCVTESGEEVWGKGARHVGASLCEGGAAGQVFMCALRVRSRFLDPGCSLRGRLGASSSLAITHALMTQWEAKGHSRDDASEERDDKCEMRDVRILKHDTHCRPLCSKMQAGLLFLYPPLFPYCCLLVISRG